VRKWLVQPEFQVTRNLERCIQCQVCVRQCANDVHSYDAEDELVTSDSYSCVGCHRCATLCPTRAISIVQAPLEFRPVVRNLARGGKDVRLINGDDGDAGQLEQLLARPHGLEGGRARADGADASAPEALHHPAHTGKGIQVARKGRAPESAGVGGGVREGNPILMKIVADGDLAAKRITAMIHVDPVIVIVTGLHEYGHVEACQVEGINNAQLIAKVRQAHNDAIDAIALLLEQPGTALGIRQRLHSSSGGGRLRQDNVFVAQGFELTQQLTAAIRRQGRVEETASADNDAEGARRVVHSVQGVWGSDFGTTIDGY